MADYPFPVSFQLSYGTWQNYDALTAFVAYGGSAAPREPVVAPPFPPQPDPEDDYIPPSGLPNPSEPPFDPFHPGPGQPGPPDLHVPGPPTSPNYPGPPVLFPPGPPGPLSIVAGDSPFDRRMLDTENPHDVLQRGVYRPPGRSIFDDLMREPVRRRAPPFRIGRPPSRVYDFRIPVPRIPMPGPVLGEIWEILREAERRRAIEERGIRYEPLPQPAPPVAKRETPQPPTRPPPVPPLPGPVLTTPRPQPSLPVPEPFCPDDAGKPFPCEHCRCRPRTQPTMPPQPPPQPPTMPAGPVSTSRRPMPRAARPMPRQPGLGTILLSGLLSRSRSARPWTFASLNPFPGASLQPSPQPFGPPTPTPAPSPLPVPEPPQPSLPEPSSPPDFGPGPTTQPLTAFQTSALRSFSECECPPGTKNPPLPSDVVADVKVYRRRMSQYSLNNLLRGKRR